MADATESASKSAPDTTPADAPAEPAAAAGGELEGEGQGSLVGIMVSEHAWSVAPWMKALSFWLAVASFGGLVAYTVAKRMEFNELIVIGAVEPEPWGKRVAPPVALLPGTTGTAVDITQFRGQWVLVNFWATWCAPCRDEMPSLEMLHRRFTRDQMPVKLVAVSVDEDWAEVNRFFGATAPGFLVLWDRDKKTAFSYGSRKFPETFLIDPEGKVAAKFVGPRDWYNQATVQYFTEVLAGTRKPS